MHEWLVNPKKPKPRRGFQVPAMSGFPPKLIFEILLRLHPDDLQRCLSVSKAWNPTIHDQQFIKSHLQQLFSHSFYLTEFGWTKKPVHYFLPSPFYDTLKSRWQPAFFPSNKEQAFGEMCIANLWCFQRMVKGFLWWPTTLMGFFGLIILCKNGTKILKFIVCPNALRQCFVWGAFAFLMETVL